MCGHSCYFSLQNFCLKWAHTDIVFHLDDFFHFICCRCILTSRCFTSWWFFSHDMPWQQLCQVNHGPRVLKFGRVHFLWWHLLLVPTCRYLLWVGLLAKCWSIRNHQEHHILIVPCHFFDLELHDYKSQGICVLTTKSNQMQGIVHKSVQQQDQITPFLYELWHHHIHLAATVSQCQNFTPFSYHIY